MISVISPNGGETLSSSVTISWVGTDPDDDVLSYTIGYNLNNQGWKLIANGISEQSYLWDISRFSDSNNVLIKVIASDGFGLQAEDVSDFVFNIDNTDVPSVVLNSPISGLTYSDVLTVNWDLTDIDNLVTSFDLYYSTNSGIDWILVTSGISPSQTDYDWNTTSIIFSNTLRLKIIANYEVDFEQQFAQGISDIFSIDNRPEMSVTLVNPNGGENYEDFVIISWNIATQPGVLYSSQLEYSIDSNTWIKIANNIKELSFNWTTNQLDYSKNYRVRVTVFGSYHGFSLDPIDKASQGTFTITPDHEAPVVSSSDDISFEEGALNKFVTWTVSDKNPHNYSIYVNGALLVENQSWITEQTINQDVSALDVGSYEFLIVVEDVWGYKTSDKVFVTISAPQETESEPNRHAAFNH